MSGLLYQFAVGFDAIGALELDMLAHNALTTVTAAKKFLGIPNDNTEKDEEVATYVNSASSFIENYCGRLFGYREFGEMLTGRDSNKLILNNYPIRELIELVADEETIDPNHLWVMNDEGMIYRKNGRFRESLTSGSFTYPRTDNLDFNIFVRYTSGYILPKDGNAENRRDLPVDLELACLKMVQIMQKDKETVEGKSLILKREQIGDWMGEYEPEYKSSKSELTFMNDDVIRILDTYKRKEFFV